MRRKQCFRHNYPCTCAMGHLYRFVEPVVLLLLKEKHKSYGYDLSSQLNQCCFTDAEVERAALYRTLRRLEKNGYVTSDWNVADGGPARRDYSLTKQGEKHLQEWGEVLGKVAASMSRFVHRVEKVTGERRTNHR